MSRRLMVAVISGLAVAAMSCSHDSQKAKREYLESGNRYFAEKKYPDAIIQYRNAVAQDARFGEARFKLGTAYEATGDLRNALSEYVRAADLMPDNVDAQVEAGKMLLATGQFQDAKVRAIAALRQDPRNVKGLVVMGNALAGLKDIDGAISQVEDAIEADPQRTLSYVNLSLLQFAKGDKSAAQSALERAVAIDPKSILAHLNLANYWWAAGDRGEAERELKTAFALDPKSTQVNRALATFYLVNGRTPEAEPHLKTYAEVTNQVGSRVILADYYVAAGKTKEAAAVLESLSKEKDGFALAKVRLAAIAFKANRQPEAYQTLETVLAREERNEDALLMKARFLLTERKFDETAKITKTIVAGNPQSLPGHFLNGAALEALGSTDEAIKAFQEALRLRPSANAVLVKLADIYLNRGDAAAAVEFLGQAVKNEPNSPVAQFLLAKSLVRLGNVSRAEPVVMGFARSNSNAPEAQTLLGDLYLKKGDLPRARASYARALDLRPNSVEALTGLVRADVVEKKNPVAAQSRIESQLAKTPDDGALLVLAGATFLMTGDVQRAESTYRHVLQVDPSNMEAYRRLGSLYLSQKRLDEAKREYEQAALRQPKAAVAATTMVGIVLTLQGKRDDARKQYEQALALDPQAAVAANNLAWDYVERGADLDVALKLAQTAKARLPKNWEVSDTLGWIYYKKGLASLAVTALRQGAEQAPSNPIVHYHLGLAYLKTGDIGQAQKSLQHALKLNPAFEGAEEAKQALATIKG